MAELYLVTSESVHVGVQLMMLALNVQTNEEVDMVVTASGPSYFDDDLSGSETVSIFRGCQFTA